MKLVIFETVAMTLQVSDYYLKTGGEKGIHRILKTVYDGRI